MLRQKRNLSAFRKYQEHVASIPSEETYISDFSDDENEENRSFNRVNNSSLGANFTDFNISVTKTPKQYTFYYTPPAKRFKRLADKRSKNLSLKESTALFRDLNSTIRNRGQSNTTIPNPIQKDEGELQELTIEWSSSDEADNTISRPLTNVSQNSTQNSMATKIKCNQMPTSSSAKKTNPFKRCRKGGYLYQLKETIEHLKTDRKFLEHDKKFGIRKCKILRVLKVENSFGVYLCTVSSQDDEISQIVLDPDISEHVKAGSILEAFVEQIDPYEIEFPEKARKVYIDPSKFILR